MGKKLTGIRIDSGDLDFLSKQARIMLDKAGLFDTKIVASNSLDENVIKKLVDNNAPIDVFGVGENLITSKSCPILGGVYKLVAIEKENQIVPKIKISDTTDKLINPHFKKLYRVYDNNNQIFTDILCVYDERLFNIKGKNNQAEDFVIKNLKPKMIEAGNLIYKIPTIEETRKKVNDEIATLKPQMLDLNNSKTIKVMLSAKLQRIKNKLMQSSQVKDL
jgi:nicotinate phosphoribosyltransferase